MLQVKNINIYINKDNRLLIENFTFNLGNNDKVAIIGEEGNGKSTLLKLLYGDLSINSYINYTGEIIRKGKFCYLPQFLLKEEANLSLSEYFEDVDIYSNYEYVELLNLNYDFIQSNQKLSTLSGGEKVKVQLLKIMCENPDALFLDEPSNDLDIETLLFLQDFIKNCNIPVVYISHDETLIEETANVIIHIEQLIRKTKCKITISKLSFNEYKKFRNYEFDRETKLALKEQAEYKKKCEKLKKLYEKAKNNKSWKNPDGIPSSDGRAKKSMQSIIAKSNRYEKEKENLKEVPNIEESIITKFDENICVHSSKEILNLDLPILSIDNKVLSKDVKLKVVGNKHIGIIGKNGVGKTTLLKEIYNILKDRKDVIVGYMPQNYSDVLNFNQTPLEFLQANYNKELYTKALTYLGSLKFTANEMKRTIGELSGGQQAKLIFLSMVLNNANVLILDEPTRNFSPLSAPVVRNALINFKGTIISISHDRKYLDEVCDLIYVLDNNGLSLL